MVKGSVSGIIIECSHLFFALSGVRVGKNLSITSVHFLPHILTASYKSLSSNSVHRALLIDGLRVSCQRREHSLQAYALAFKSIEYSCSLGMRLAGDRTEPIVAHSEESICGTRTCKSNSLRSGCRERTYWDTKVHLEGSTDSFSVDQIVTDGINHSQFKDSMSVERT